MIAGAAQSSTPSGAVWRGTARVRGSSELMRMVILTSSLIGIQFTWGIEMAYCTPYLLALGLSKSTISLVWIAGPLSGLLVQPLVGMLADQSTSPFGRRRPFMFIGSLLTILALFVLGWTRECIAFVWPGAGAQAAIVLAVTAIYMIDFAINAVMAASRSLIVDTLPANKQQTGSAWASRMAAIGHLIIYAVGAMDLSKVFGDSIGDTQFKRLVVVAACALALCVSITCIGVQERVLVGQDGEHKSEAVGIMPIISRFSRTLRTLPRGISTICWVTFWVWLGWFPFLVYSSTWIGEIYLRYEIPTMHHKKGADTVERVGRVGSTALIAYSVVHTLGSIVIPWIVKSPDEAKDFTMRPPAKAASLLMTLHKLRPTLLTAWVYSIMIFCACMMCTPFVTSLEAATLIVAVCGIPWTVQCWAPFTFLGIEVNRLAAPTTPTSKTRSSTDGSRPALIDLEKTPSTTSAALSSSSSASELTGSYLGILNLYVTFPQFICSFISCAVFGILDAGNSGASHHEKVHATTGPNAISVCLFIGGAAAMMAVRQARRLSE